MRFELINPSDKYFFEAPSLEVAALCVLQLGRGLYSASQIDGDAEVPFFAFGADPDAWFKASFGRSLKDSVAIVDLAQVCACFRSFEIPGPGEHDEKRSSVTDIRARALSLADSLAERGAA